MARAAIHHPSACGRGLQHSALVPSVQKIRVANGTLSGHRLSVLRRPAPDSPLFGFDRAEDDSGEDNA